MLRGTSSLYCQHLYDDNGHDEGEALVLHSGQSGHSGMQSSRVRLLTKLPVENWDLKGRGIGGGLRKPWTPQTFMLVGHPILGQVSANSRMGVGARLSGACKNSYLKLS